MRMRRRSRVVWSSAGVPVPRLGDRGRSRPAHRVRTWWWLRTGALLTVLGVVRLARFTRAHRRNTFLIVGTLLTVLSIALGSMATFVGGMLVWALARPWHWDEPASK